MVFSKYYLHAAEYVPWLYPNGDLGELHTGVPGQEDE